jgi:hypothetical protein
MQISASEPDHHEIKPAQRPNGNDAQDTLAHQERRKVLKKGGFASGTTTASRLELSYGGRSLADLDKDIQFANPRSPL